MYAPIIKEDLKRVVKELGFGQVDIVLSIPENSAFGDYSSNVALQLAKQKTKKGYQSSHLIANEIVNKLGHPDYFERVEVAGPGFINFFLSLKSLIRLVEVERIKTASEEHVLVEYAQPNTHKELHIGHLRNLTIGESLARILEDQGVKVFRANYGSDIGLPVAKALYGVIQNPARLAAARASSIQQKAEFLSESYVFGNTAYEEDPSAKSEIDRINKSLYDRDPKIVPLWQETKQWSLAYFDIVYLRLNTEFDRVILESEVEELGTKLVMDNLCSHSGPDPESIKMDSRLRGNDKCVFTKSEGAIIFPGEEYGLHNRVFITSKGNPTYEAKELGLTLKEQELFPYDLSLHVIDSQQSDYFKVVNKALELLKIIHPDKKRHISYGFVSLSTGRMSSRKGNIAKLEDLINDVKTAINQEFKEVDPPTVEKIAIGAIKFYLLKYSLASDIVFDVKKSISLQGDSGAYIQYTYARIQSLLAKIKVKEFKIDLLSQKVEEEERLLLSIIEHFDSFVEKAASSYQPNELCTYLIQLCHAYNLFYQKYPIIKSEQQNLRAAISKKVGYSIKDGLYLLGIEAPERM